MSDTAPPNLADRFNPIAIDLKNPALAALLAWAWPGAGHLYQRRYGKAFLFMISILVIYFWGLSMGDGHVVYASFRPNDMRYQYLLQVGVGLPALPAVLQANLTGDDGHGPLGEFMSPPRGEVREQEHDEKAVWNFDLGFYFELGTLFTMVAGLLNVLVIYDAYAGPAFTKPEGFSEDDHPDELLARRRDNLSSLLRTLGITGGLVLALHWRTTFDVYSSLLTYGFAAGGMVAGGLLGRGLSQVLGRRLYRDLPIE